MKIDRLLSITLQLINRSMVTARELSEKYEVSVRTIYRDIESISAAGIPVTSYQGKDGGFCLIDNYRVDRQLLSLNDMVSILMALKGLNTTFTNDNITEAIEKIESLVPDDKKCLVDKHFENVIIDLSLWGESGAQKEKLQLINSCIHANMCIQFSYRNLIGDEGVRVVEPMSLVLKSFYWYLFAYCRNKNDYRIFRLSRMLECKKLDILFVRKNKIFNQNEFFNDAIRKTIKITLKFSPDAKSRVEEYYAEHVKSVTVDGYSIVEIDYPEDEWVYSNILSYGDTVEVISPAHLREIIMNRLCKAKDLYN
jgi:predicted DNA-binding transcriptional regulator YafY